MSSSVTLKLVGLPFTASETDVRGFLEKHVTADQLENLTSLQVGGKKAKKNGPGRGEGWAVFSLDDASPVVEKLHKQYIGDRFVEVSPLEDEPNAAGGAEVFYSNYSLLSPRQRPQTHWTCQHIIQVSDPRHSIKYSNRFYGLFISSAGRRWPFSCFQLGTGHKSVGIRRRPMA